jgi:hypothetical protein
MITFTKQADGNYAVQSGGRFIGIVGRDASGWWGNYTHSEDRPGRLIASMYAFNGHRTRRAAAESLAQWHEETQGLAQGSSS